MVTDSRPGAVSFSLLQLRTLMEWSATRPQGFAVRVMTDHEDYPELAELYTHDKMSPLWFLNATEAGTVVITKASGADQEFGTIEEALARVLELEKPAPDAAWLKRAHQQRLSAPLALPRAVTMRARRAAREGHDAVRKRRPAQCRPATPLLSRDEAAQFAALRTILPEGWVAELQADAGMAWVAFVYDAEAPRSGPMFTICRWDDRVGLLAQWTNGEACSVMPFTELEPILELVLDGILISMQPHSAAMSTKGRASTQH